AVDADVRLELQARVVLRVEELGLLLHLKAAADVAQGLTGDERARLGALEPHVHEHRERLVVLERRGDAGHLCGARGGGPCQRARGDEGSQVAHPTPRKCLRTAGDRRGLTQPVSRNRGALRTLRELRAWCWPRPG